ncbi:MAG TPA: hypothetical protein DCG19_04225 [Cryomorphaceae bacterium]|nr:hypothetical protein [Owenweeksia sp.]MBF99603.1 hypothetical protein [Owenweeksia sp.]HAD96588.1 hypothetical protein [Cryomorphaceae bacterium]HBF21686.1 hypothetical protein [Cryomorphaceae bacterium]HCQ15184.1 hypothetical protein [Cryomorphaceae bacterium]|tara:strand:- start:721 stop:1128 length:408 start_codon:yes stop_codon:yes gene_type:complete
MTKEHLSEFITKFIQPGYGLRKGEKNHIYYIHKTINRVFAKHMGKQEKYSPEEILNAFHKNDFQIKEEHNGLCSLEDGVKFHDAWVKLKGDDIKDLYLTITEFPSHTNNEKVMRIKALESRLRQFKAASIKEVEG